MTMFAVVIALALQQTAVPPGPAPARASAAQCADRLISKNHGLPVESLVLARRITDECYKEPIQAGSEKPAVTPELWQNIKGDFQRIVLDRVLAARAEALKLAR